MERYLDIAIIITSVALIVSVILQSKGAGLGGLGGSDTGAVFTARVTIGLSVIFFGLAIASVWLPG